MKWKIKEKRNATNKRQMRLDIGKMWMNVSDGLNRKRISTITKAKQC